MTAIAPITASSAGFAMPAEWSPHECCWMAWPNSEPVWGDMLERSQRAYADVANAIAAFEPVRMLTPPTALKQARSLCGAGVEIIPWALDDAWMRDMGPNFVKNAQGEVAASIFQFNAWGQKYRCYRQDAALGNQLAESLGMRSFTSPIFMEGGGINTDGEGTLLTTEQCILHENRNPDISKQEAEDHLCAALGVEKVIWLRGDPEDHETDGHVDGIACFVRPGMVLAEWDRSVKPGTQSYDYMQEDNETLRNAVDAQGRTLNVELIQAGTQAEVLGDRFYQSYINFYIANGGVVVPGYGVTDEDQAAKDALKRCFPDREIVMVDANAIAFGGGGIHCITQQQPRATPGVALGKDPGKSPGHSSDLPLDRL